MKIDNNNHYYPTIGNVQTVKSVVGNLIEYVDDYNKQLNDWFDANKAASENDKSKYHNIDIVYDTIPGANVDLNNLAETTLLDCDRIFVNLASQGSLNAVNGVFSDGIYVSFLKYCPKSSEGEVYMDALNRLKSVCLDFCNKYIDSENLNITSDVDVYDGNYASVQVFVSDGVRLKVC